MSATDPVAVLLAVLDGPASPRPEFQHALRVRLLAELQSTPAHGGKAGRWFTFARAASATHPTRGLRLVLVLIALLLLLLAAIATARYVVQQRSVAVKAIAGVRARPNGVMSVDGIGPDGRLTTIWRCPRNRFCGELTGVAWAPDGRRIAVSLTEFAAHSTYPGLHVIDTKTGRDRKIIGSGSDISRFGCWDPDDLAWSPDGTRIAYTCDNDNGFRDGKPNKIYIVRADGSNPMLLHTAPLGAAWPSWSPDGLRIAFSTATHAWRSSRVYTIGLFRRDLRLVATAAAAPAWSPDGSLIAYRSACGSIRLATPDGHDATTRHTHAPCPGIRPPGWPAWSPDGTRIAIGTANATWVVDRDGTRLRLVSGFNSSHRTAAGTAFRPAWQPPPGKRRT